MTIRQKNTVIIFRPILMVFIYTLNISIKKNLATL